MEVSQEVLDSVSLQTFSFIKSFIPSLKDSAEILGMALDKLQTQRDINEFKSERSLGLYLRLCARNYISKYLNK